MSRAEHAEDRCDVTSETVVDDVDDDVARKKPVVAVQDDVDDVLKDDDATCLCKEHVVSVEDEFEPRPVGLECCIRINVVRRRPGCSPVSPTSLHVCVRYPGHADPLFSGAVSVSGDGAVVTVRPTLLGRLLVSARPPVHRGLFHRGPHHVCLRSVLEVDRVMSLCTFNEGASRPVAAAYHPRPAPHGLLYVAYSRHISVFRGDGQFVAGLLDLCGGYYNDLAVSPGDGRLLAAAVSGWEEDREVEGSRFREVHLYDVTGAPRLVEVVGRSQADEPVPSVAFMTPTRFLITDAHVVCVYDVDQQRVVDRVVLSTSSCISRLAHHAGRLYALDPAASALLVTDLAGRTVQRVVVPGGAALRGLAVDEQGHCVVTDCVTGHISVCSERGVTRVSCDYDNITWPLHVTVDGRGHCYVVDHGGCGIKKIRYK